MPKWLNGEAVFGVFMILVFLSGAQDLLKLGGFEAAMRDEGIAFALLIVAISCILLGIVVVKSFKSDEPAQTPVSRRGMLIFAVGLSYPLLFWAIEFLLATTIVGILALGLFVERFGKKEILTAVIFALGTYGLFFFLLGITEPDGALFSTGLNDVLPSWRRDLFAYFGDGS